MNVPFLDLKREYAPLKDEIMRSLEEVVDSQHFILGPHVRHLEEAAAGYLGVRHAIGVASGSDALLLSLMACGIREGDEVITTPFTFFATAGAIARLGAVPVFADIDLRTYNIEHISVEAKITPKTMAIIPVHLFGQAANMLALRSLTLKYNRLAVIEDSCQAMGESCTYLRKKAGGIGSTGCFSFFPTKNLGGLGDGGLVTTDCDGIAEKIRRLRVHGAEKKYVHKEIGINSRLDELQAAAILVKMKHLEEWNQKRHEHAQYYSAHLQDIVTTPYVHPLSQHIYHQYVIATGRRDELAAHLKQAGIETGIYYPLPLHLQECFAYLGYRPGDFPMAEEASRTVLSLPIFPSLTSAEKEHVVTSIRGFFEKR